MSVSSRWEPKRHRKSNNCAGLWHCTMKCKGLLLGVLGGAWVLCAGCSDTPSVTMPPLDPAAIAQEALSRYDVNSDGRLDSTELEASPALSALLLTVKNHDAGHADSLTVKDIAVRVEAWKRSGAVVLGGGTRITFDGKPLAGALVTWEPEAYLGPFYHPMSGTTNEQGYAVIAP